LIIVGNGLLAKEFSKNKTDDDVLIIASGVSNSKEIKEEEFVREENLIRDVLQMHKNLKIVFFSTCSIMQSEKTPYILHKIKMEQLIRNLAMSHYIFRLPQAVGIVNNNTLVSNLVKNAYLNNRILIQNDAFRNPLDVEDISRIVLKVVETKIPPNRDFLNISPSNEIRVLDIAEEIRSLLCSESKIILVPGGERYSIDNSDLKRYIDEKDRIFSEKYSVEVIRKYANKIVEKYSCQWEKERIFNRLSQIRSGAI
jgi:nucleoside-diphosphate-sugar epimerase